MKKLTIGFGLAIIAAGVAVCATRAPRHTEDFQEELNSGTKLVSIPVQPQPVAPPQPGTESRLEPGTFKEYLAHRRRSRAALTRIPVEPRWGFSPRKALEPLGEVGLFYAIAPSDTGASDPCSEGICQPHHFGFTVWKVKMKRDGHADLRIACVRLVDRPTQAVPVRPPIPWCWEISNTIHRNDKIRGKWDVPICGDFMRVTHLLPWGQCISPGHEDWQAEFVAGGWAFYLTASFTEGGDAKASGLDLLCAADRITEALRSAKTGLKRPAYTSCNCKEIHLGKAEAWFDFSLKPARGREICIRLSNLVSWKESESGIRGYRKRILKFGDTEVVRGKATTGRKNGVATRGLQFDWCDEFGIGGSVLREVDR